MSGGQQVRSPAPRPCESCPYRCDVPSGVWEASEYEKLPAYDNETPYQPAGVFLCHQQDGRMCAGWVGCHGADDLLALRLAVVRGVLSPADMDATLDWHSPVPLFGSGAEAAAHGVRNVAEPDDAAVRMSGKLARRRGSS